MDRAYGSALKAKKPNVVMHWSGVATIHIVALNFNPTKKWNIFDLSPVATSHFIITDFEFHGNLKIRSHGSGVATIHIVALDEIQRKMS
jgi:hypothetical protein